VAAALALLACAGVRADRNVRASRWVAVAERALRRDTGVVGAAEALGALNFALDATPADCRAQLRYAQALLREHRSSESAAAARRALALEPYLPNALGALAAADFDAGDDIAARHDATQALALLRDYPVALHIRAQAADREGDGASAAADRRQLRVLAENPQDGDTARAARTLLESAE
jgi:hypothetical protein